MNRILILEPSWIFSTIAFSTVLIGRLSKSALILLRVPKILT